MSPSLLEQAKGGDAAAIAALMNQALQAKGVTVTGDRQGDCLQLWLTAPTLPPQAATVDYVRRGIGRLQVASLGLLQIYGGQTDQPQPSWGVEVDLRAATAKVRPLTLEPELEPELEPAQTSAPEPAVTSSGAAPGTIAYAYALLGLELGDSLQKVEGTYFKQKALALREGDRPKVEELKQAFHQLKNHIENPPPVEQEASAENPELADPLNDESLTPVQRVEILLKRQGVGAQISTQGNQLYISWLAVRVFNPEEAAQQVHALLTQPNLVAMGFGGIETLVISGLSRDHSVVWQQTMPVAKR
jgi:hypothetical protein